jgi:hypothetical protein
MEVFCQTAEVGGGVDSLSGEPPLRFSQFACAVGVGNAVFLHAEQSGAISNGIECVHIVM